MTSFVQIHPIWRLASRILQLGGLACTLLTFSMHMSRAQDATPESMNRTPKTKVPSAASDGANAQEQDTLRDLPIPGKVLRYAQHLLERYDRNRDGVLNPDEWKALHGHPDLIDRNRDGSITLDELSRWVAEYGQRRRIGVVPVAPVNGATVDSDATTGAPPAAEVDAAANGNQTAKPDRRRSSKFYVPSNRLPEGLPEWFLAKDEDGDGQLTAGEYSPKSVAAELAEFNQLDANGDGVVTAKECVRKPADAASSPKKPAKSPSQ